MKIKDFFQAALTVLTAVMTVSCVETNDLFSNEAFKFSVKTDGPLQTRSEAVSQTEHMDLSFDGMNITLTATASAVMDDPFSSIATKAAAVNSASDFSSFKMNIAGVAEGVDVAKGSGDIWAIQRASADVHYEWPSDASSGVRFDAVYGKGASISGNTVTYTMTDSDLLIARTFATKNAVPVTFYHPLAALRFKVKGFVDGFTVKSITLSELYTSGTFTLPSEGQLDKPVNLREVSWSGLSNAADVHPNLYNSDKDDFFIIPQSTEGVTMTITFSQPNGPDKTLEVKMPQAGLKDGSWKPGYYYTYTISGGGYVEVEAYDEMDGVSTSQQGSTKTNARMNNVGSLPVRVRAYVVANWYNDAGKVVAPYTGSNLAFATGHWTKNPSDGFYYYDSVVAADTNTSNLIDEFTPDKSSAPAGTGFGLHAEMQVIFQAIEAEKAASVWSFFN